MIYKFLTLKYINFSLGFSRGILFAFFMGPEGFAVWSFISLIYTYSMYSNFGLDSSTSLLMAKNEELSDKKRKIVLKSFRVLIVCLAVPALVFPVVWITGETFEKYIVDFELMLMVLVITLLGLLIKQLYVVARNEKMINLVAISQIVIILFTMLSALIFNDEMLYSALVFWSVGEIVIILYLYFTVLKDKLNICVSDIFIGNKLMDDKSLLSEIIKCSMVLFLTNIAFSLIALLTRAFASNVLSVAEFGVFSLAFSIAYAVYMVIGNVIWAKYPHMIRIYSNSGNLRAYYKNHLMLVILLSSVVLIAGAIFGGFVFENMKQYEGGFLYYYWFIASFIVLSETLIDRMIIQSSGREIMLIVPASIVVFFMALLFLFYEEFYYEAGSAKIIFISYAIYSIITKLILYFELKGRQLKMFLMHRFSFLMFSLSALYFGSQSDQLYLYAYLFFLMSVVILKKNMVLDFLKRG